MLNSCYLHSHMAIFSFTMRFSCFNTTSWATLYCTILIGSLLAACNSCRSTRGKITQDTTLNEPSTVRIYVLSDLAGALEPCGCQKDMLGGVDHFAALVRKEQTQAPHSAVVAVGPTFFMDSTLNLQRAQQDIWKAEAIANGLRQTGLAACTPGKNDWSSGSELLANLQKQSNAALVAANLSGVDSTNIVASSIREINKVKVAFLGVSMPIAAGKPPDGVQIQDALQALSIEAKKVRTQGARIVIGLAALENRGIAIRAAEYVPELDVLAVGSGFTDGDVNDEPKSPKFVGPVLVVQPSNHLTRVAAIDFYVRDQQRFADGSNITQSTEATNLSLQIDDLKKRIVAWEANPKTSKQDLDTQRKRLDELRAKLETITTSAAPPSGSFLRYTLMDIRSSLGKDAQTAEAMSSYYKRVNEFNKTKFAGKRAAAPSSKDAFYVGINACTPCHTAAYEVWKNTPHSRAYQTLSVQFKEFNLECVSCHVTAYEKPGGSTVTDVEALRNVQCEQCHGPGSKHIQDPKQFSLPKKVEEQTCIACHHPPHTERFKFSSFVEIIKGPGHGQAGAPPHVEPPKNWRPPKPRYETEMSPTPKSK